MDDKYYKKLGSKIAQFVDQEKFTYIELGKLIEQYYKILKNEHMRDLREIENKK